MAKGTLKYITGDVTNPQKINPDNVVIIPHCCNNLGVMGAGVALALKKKWSEVYESYKEASMGLGTVSFADTGSPEDIEYSIIVANMIGQYKTVSPDNPKPVRYHALAVAMAKVVEFAGFHLQGQVEFHCPKFGSALAGGDWKIIEALIQEIWIDNGYDVVVYDFVPPNHKPKPLYKTEITVWTDDYVFPDENGKGGYPDMATLVREAHSGDAYCTKTECTRVKDIFIEEPENYQGLSEFFFGGELGDEVDTGEEQIKFRNFYRCSDCNTEWDDEWSCTCNDKCPDCNKEIEPYLSEDI
jgi:O-acetyl-ADP-ribose deacetylase (regulator of RNase III)